MFPQNEFWQCPSHMWSSLVVGALVTLVVMMSFMINFGVGVLMYGVGIFFTLFWLTRTFIHWLSPDVRCEARGFPGQHYANPFA
jgi:hypothetical protein